MTKNEDKDDRKPITLAEKQAFVSAVMSVLNQMNNEHKMTYEDVFEILSNTCIMACKVMSQKDDDEFNDMCMEIIKLVAIALPAQFWENQLEDIFYNLETKH